MQPSDPPSHCNSSSAENYNKALPPSYKASFQEEDSLENTQRIERGLARYNASPNVFKRWLFEILSVITSAFCMGKKDQHNTFNIDPLTLCRGDNCNTCFIEGPTTGKMASWAKHH
jgi:hypothetical protein